MVTTATTAPIKTQERGHAISTLSLATPYLYFIYLLDSIVASFLLLYRPPRSTLPILPSIMPIDVTPLISTFVVRDS